MPERYIPNSPYSLNYLQESKRAGILALLSHLYGYGMRLRSSLYKKAILNYYIFPCPVISIGNITVGGTGKTPFTQFLGEHFRDQGIRTAILSRGYKRPESSHGVTVVSDFETIRTEWQEAGDEPYHLAETLYGVSVLVSPSRIKSGSYAINELKSKLLLMDDGFSHLKVHPDINLLLIDITNPFGYGYCFPRGRLREPLTALGRASAIILTRTNPEEDYSELISEIKKYAPKSPILKSSFIVRGLKQIMTNELIPVEKFNKEKIIGVSGLGNPGSFEDLLESLEFNVLHHYACRDHYIYQQKDIEDIKRTVKKLDAHLVITTSKDALKMKSYLQPEDTNWYSLEIGFRLEKENQFWEFIEEGLKSAGAMI